jgi:branched-chain amino acid transport system ATP-binding protein
MGSPLVSKKEKAGGRMPDLIIATNNVTKRFGGLTAVDCVDIDIPKGYIYSIIGPNGAGKTTFFNCISGFYKPEDGAILYLGSPIQGSSTDFVASCGISRTYQNIRLFKNLTALENILVGQHTNLKSNWLEAIIHTPRFNKEHRESLIEAKRLLGFVGLDGFGDFLACNLPYGMQRRLEIARALANKPTLLLLDEPTAGMNPHESEDMIKLIRKLRDDLGISIILIEHDMRVVMDISDKISVLDYGKKIAEGSPKEIQSNERVIEAYLGPGGAALAEKYQNRRRKNA